MVARVRKGWAQISQSYLIGIETREGQRRTEGRGRSQSYLIGIETEYQHEGLLRELRSQSYLIGIETPRRRADGQPLVSQSYLIGIETCCTIAGRLFQQALNRTLLELKQALLPHHKLDGSLYYPEKS